jgi:hypothetical protein
MGHRVWIVAPNRDGAWTEEVLDNGISAMKTRAQQYPRATTIVTRIQNVAKNQSVLVVGQADGVQMLNVWGGGTYRGHMVIGSEDGRRINRKGLENILRELSTQPETTQQPGWLYGPRLVDSGQLCTLHINHATMDTEIKQLIGATDTDICGVISGIEEQSQNAIVVIGRTTAHQGEMNCNEWVQGMYGPVVATGGIRHENGGYTFYATNEITVMRYLTWLYYHPATPLTR